jgi:hypothetical protein
MIVSERKVNRSSCKPHQGYSIRSENSSHSINLAHRSLDSRGIDVLGKHALGEIDNDRQIDASLSPGRLSFDLWPRKSSRTQRERNGEHHCARSPSAGRQRHTHSIELHTRADAIQHPAAPGVVDRENDRQ